jgi:hypothetical protein
LSGVSIGIESAVCSTLLIADAVLGVYLLTTVGVIMSMGSFGPVTDNAQGIAEMSSDVEGDAFGGADPSTPHLVDLVELRCTSDGPVMHLARVTPWAAVPFPPRTAVFTCALSDPC